MKFNFLLLFVATLFVFTNCADDPNSVGSDLIPDGDKLSYNKVDTFPNTKFSSYQVDSLNFGGSSRVLLGKFENVTSDVLVRFSISLPDSIEEGLDTNTTTLQKAWVSMMPNYWIGDSSALSFSAYQIKESWNTAEFTQDTIDAIKANLGNDIIDQGTFDNRDTAIVFDIDKEVVSEWARAGFDDGDSENEGMIFIPTSENSLAGFQALTSYPTSDYIRLNMVFESSEGYLDTVSATPSLDLHWAEGKTLDNPEGRIILQGLLGVRSKLFFDVSEIPQDIVLNSAELKLNIDLEKTSWGSIHTDTLAVEFLSDSSTNEVETTYGRYALSKNAVDTTFYKGDIRQFVQRWIDGENNMGLSIKTTDEVRRASIIYLYGANAEVDTLKPKLTLYYSFK